MSRILVLDDDDAVREMLSTLLADAGYEVVSRARQGDIAPEARFDAVISDLGEDSYEPLTARGWVDSLSARFAPAPVIICTAHAAAIREPGRLRAAAVIGRPFDVDELLRTVGEVLS